MSQFKPSVPTFDEIVSRVNAKQFRTIVINGTPYIARDIDGRKKTPYYSNFIKRIIAAGYVLFGKGMVIRFSEDLYAKDEIKTVTYE